MNSGDYVGGMERSSALVAIGELSGKERRLFDAEMIRKKVHHSYVLVLYKHSEVFILNRKNELDELHSNAEPYKQRRGKVGTVFIAGRFTREVFWKDGCLESVDFQPLPRPYQDSQL